jgi:hypothetical protein
MNLEIRVFDAIKGSVSVVVCTYYICITYAYICTYICSTYYIVHTVHTYVSERKSERLSPAFSGLLFSPKHSKYSVNCFWVLAACRIIRYINQKSFCNQSDEF